MIVGTLINESYITTPNLLPAAAFATVTIAPFSASYLQDALILGATNSTLSSVVMFNVPSLLILFVETNNVVESAEKSSIVSPLNVTPLTLTPARLTIFERSNFLITTRFSVACFAA